MEQNYNSVATKYKYFFLEDKAESYGLGPQKFVVHKVEGELNDNFRFVGFKLACGTAYFEGLGYSLKNALNRAGAPSVNPHAFSNKRRCPICFPNEQ